MLMGLLHDVGKALLAVHAASVLSSLGKRDALSDLGPAALHVLHPRVGGLLVKRWGLSGSLAALVAYHHDPDPPHRLVRGVAILRLADLIYQRWLLLGRGIEGDGVLFSHELTRLLELDHDEFARLLGRYAGTVRAFSRVPGLA